MKFADIQSILVSHNINNRELNSSYGRDIFNAFRKLHKNDKTFEIMSFWHDDYSVKYVAAPQIDKETTYADCYMGSIDYLNGTLTACLYSAYDSVYGQPHAPESSFVVKIDERLDELAATIAQGDLDYLITRIRQKEMLEQEQVERNRVLETLIITNKSISGV
jgi:hypothetical protein